ncbi:MAG: thioredoxin family protein [Ferruginibacter sp.]
MKFILCALLFTSSFSLFAQENPAHAEKVMYAAYNQAAAENKSVLLMFHASWCGWCKKMDASLNDESIKKYITDNFIITHLTVDERGDKLPWNNPGADDLRKTFHAETAGLPFWVILDRKGSVLADSYTRKPGQTMNEPGQNIGCPASEVEVQAFITALRKTTSLNETALTAIYSRFRKNEVSR